MNKIIRDGVSVILITPTKETILVLRQDGGGWEPPTGAIEKHETAEQAAVREVFEEIGLVIEQKDLTLNAIFYLKNGSNVKTFFVFVDNFEWLNLKPQITEVQEIKAFSYSDLCKLRKEEEEKDNNNIIIGYGAFHRTARILMGSLVYFKRKSSNIKYKFLKKKLMSGFRDSLGSIWKPV